MEELAQLLMQARQHLGSASRRWYRLIHVRRGEWDDERGRAKPHHAAPWDLDSVRAIWDPRRREPLPFPIMVRGEGPPTADGRMPALVRDELSPTHLDLHVAEQGKQIRGLLDRGGDALVRAIDVLPASRYAEAPKLRPIMREALHAAVDGRSKVDDLADEEVAQATLAAAVEALSPAVETLIGHLNADGIDVQLQRLRMVEPKEDLHAIPPRPRGAFQPGMQVAAEWCDGPDVVTGGRRDPEAAPPTQPTLGRARPKDATTAMQGRVADGDAAGRGERDELPKPLTSVDLLVLRAMVTIAADELAPIPRIAEEGRWPAPNGVRYVPGEKAIRASVNKLIRLGLAERPDGPSRGARLTSAGRRRAARIEVPEDDR